MRVGPKFFATLLPIGLFLMPLSANAHAFGEQYTLPLPFQFYAFGASCVLIVSFIFLALYSEPEASLTDTPATGKTLRIPYWSIVEIVLRIIGVAGFIGTIVFAFFAPQDFTINPAPELFWTILLLGFTYLSVFIGNLWRFVSPFETISRVIFSKSIDTPTGYPAWFGYFPALVFYIALIWFELLSYGAGAVPAIVGAALLAYMALSILGAGFFGVDEWFTHADFFTVFFGLVGRFAPVQIDRGAIVFQLPAERLIVERAERMSLLASIVFMLSSTAFDGLQETRIWWDTFYRSSAQMRFYTLEQTLLLVATPLIFLGLYACAIGLMRILTRSNLSITTLMLRFAFSLIPIAIAYNVAHYFTLLINGVQALSIMASDPLGKGWDIFGTAHSAINIGIIGAKEIWIAQFCAILLGHIIATYVAHRIALREFSTRSQIFSGQLPMLVLMVFYTVFGLWILSQGYQLPA
jgi:hypothetical protein